MNCGECKHRFTLPGNAHIGCRNRTATVRASHKGILNGWCSWPLDFDPVWIESCDSFKKGDEAWSEPQPHAPSLIRFLRDNGLELSL